MNYKKIKWREFPMVIGRGRPREHPQPTFCITTKKKREGNPVAHARTQGFNITNILYYSIKEKNVGEIRACARYHFW
jgi:hypothetical protein